MKVRAVRELDALGLVTGDEPALLGVHHERIGDTQGDKRFGEMSERLAPDELVPFMVERLVLVPREPRDERLAFLVVLLVGEQVTQHADGLVHAPVLEPRAIDDEIDIAPLMSGLDADGALNVLPVVVAKDAALVFRHWRPGVPLEVGPWNTQHPGPDSAEAVPDVLLVPMLAFDSDGYRIGWGGGFYDRTIATLRSQRPTLVIGVAYSGQRVDAVPRGDHDQPLDWVVTDEGSVEISGVE